LSLGKKHIIKKASSKALISDLDSNAILNSFLSILKTRKKTNVSNFGVFYRRETPQRIGRNPKTKEEFIISSRNKLSFKASTNLKKIIN
jgi:nucleoid DNA-binding protein